MRPTDAPHNQISIHAPRMGSDDDTSYSEWAGWISIHAPRMGSDLSGLDIQIKLIIFLSTPPAWGATANLGRVFACYEHFYPRPPHGERRRYNRESGPEMRISIHAPRMGSDWHPFCRDQRLMYFYPRPPHGERQQTWRKKCPVCVCLLCKVRKHPNNSLKSRGLSPKFASPYIKLSKNLCILRCEPPGKIMSDHGSHYSPEESAF